ncbi:Unknown protein, partial [Striga hermonthica]
WRYSCCKHSMLDCYWSIQERTPHPILHLISQVVHDHYKCSIYNQKHAVTKVRPLTFPEFIRSQPTTAKKVHSIHKIASSIYCLSPPFVRDF